MINNDEFEDDEFEDNEFEDNEFEDNEFEDNEFEDNEFEDNEFEDNEFEDNEFEDNEFEDNEFEDNEFEDNEFEDNEFEDNEFEDNEFEDNEFEDNEFEDDEVVKGEVVKENILSNESNQLDDEFMKNLKLSKDKLDEIDPIIPINSIVNKGENNINITFNSEDTTRNIEQIKLKNFNQVTYTESSTQNREENKEVVKHLTKIGKTQEEIATYLGCSQSSVSLYLDEIKEEKNTN